jgi:hypothetical protein
MTAVVIAGAEKQAAVSAALAYPERRFLFLTDQPVVDGWDLPNVVIARASPERRHPDEAAGELRVPCCPRWLTAPERRSLAEVSARLARSSVRFLPVGHEMHDRQSEYIVKGDLRHRPDAVVYGDAQELSGVDDPNACGVVYQRRLRNLGTFQVTGRREPDGRASIAVVRVLGETHCREEFLMAGETVDEAELAEQSLEALRVLGVSGFFYANWIQSDAGFFMTSLRPIAKAVFATARNAGIDLLSDLHRGVHLTTAGYRFVADYHYASFRTLV